MSRVVESTEGSLDLLLDTITNTFGGVLFLAILIAILTQVRGELSDASFQEDVPQEEVIRLQNQLSEALANLTSLQVTRVEQASLIDSFLDADLMQQWDDLKAIKAIRDRHIQARLETLDAIAEKQTTINTIAQALKQLNGELEKARAKVIAIRKALQEEIKSRTKTAQLPKTHGTSRIEVAVILRYGKLYFQHRNPDNPFLRSLNTDDFAVIGEDAAYVRVTPKPYRGVDVTPDNTEALARQISQISTSTCYFCVAVWDDSFDEFAILRSTLVNLGYEYRILPIPQGEAVVEAHVENPQVQ